MIKYSQVVEGTHKYGNGKDAHINKNHSSLSSRAYGFESCTDCKKKNKIN